MKNILKSTTIVIAAGLLLQVSHLLYLLLEVLCLPMYLAEKIQQSLEELNQLLMQEIQDGCL